MKDIHSHLLFGIDDGCENKDESLNLLKSLASSGVKELVLTPHYINDSKYSCDVVSKKNLYHKLLKEVEKENIDIKLYLGNEIFLDDNLLELLKNKKIESINNSRYLLIELPVINYPKSAVNIFSELIYAGYRIILAHPERYMYVNKEIKILDEFKSMGVLFQGNYASLFGKYGKGADKTLRKLLKKGYISFLAGDIHHEVDYDEKKLKRVLKKYLSKDAITQVLQTNFDLVIQNKEISNEV